MPELDTELHDSNVRLRQINRNIRQLGACRECGCVAPLHKYAPDDSGRTTQVCSQCHPEELVLVYIQDGDRDGDTFYADVILLDDGFVIEECAGKSQADANEVARRFCGETNCIIVVK